jgi:PHD/YefM family antitoxin component YafN of YafNO toxin-antitoxin module
MIQQLINNERFTNIQKAQAGLTKLLTKAKNKSFFYRILKNDQPLGVLIPENMWQSLTEDLEALSSPAYRIKISKARNQKHTSLTEFKKTLNL